MENILILPKRASWFSAVLLLLVTLLGVSCKTDIYDEFDQGVNAPLALSTSKESVVLQETIAASEAVAFNWTTGSNYGTNNSISYTLYLDRQGNNFQNAVVADMGKASFQKKYSVKEFNDLLLGLNLTPGVETTIEAKVVSKVSGTDLSDSTSTTLKVTPYQPVSTTLYLIGDATPNGWSADNATPLTLNPSSPGRFSWQGRLKAGSFKFITTKGAFLPSYNKGATENLLVYRTSDSEPDNQFTITTPGLYSISISLLDKTISIEEGSAPPYSELWIVGDATPNGWNIDNPNKLRVDRSNPYVFTYNEVLKAGEFKFPTSTGNWGTDFYMPLTNYQDLSLTGVQLVRGGSPDLKWKITTPGAYKIKLDLETMKIDIKPFTPPTQIWFVGDATPNGWDIGNATLLVSDAANPNIFTYTGALKAGEFKFPLQKDFSGDYYMPITANEDVTGTEMKFVPGGQPDNKWKISAAQAGNYKITIDVLHETIKFEKQ
ncbi:SusF/SusE family outer membrane protein [Rufibacter sediminis]|uniref:SusF/SusE family outer membrane protein n=1 Tax=Rufibacter sediminis TaxID=2762756 RepID=A0ABR6VP56_9BACT|nr:SusF/SusE family outer membrane protein [Rufibacter sediminis]MBC3538981.1 SusF/SusE family outer membrane protein [Rufibacter sediminis]